MAFESNNFNVAKKIKLPTSEFNVECNISVDEQISKIFAVSSQAFVDTKEVLAGSVAYSGVIESCVVFMTENGEVGSTHTSCPFTSKFEDPQINADQKVCLRTKVLSYNITNITTTNIAITFTLKQSGFLVGNNEVQSVSTNDEDIPVKEEEIKVIRFAGETTTVFNSNSSLNTREPIKKLLLCESQASIKSAEAGINFVTVSGEVVSRVLYITENDRFESAYVFDTFKQEVELDGVTRESQIEANAFVRYSEVKAVVDNSENGAKIELDVPVELCLMAYDEVEIKVISDLYSTKNEALIATDSFDMTRTLPLEIVDGKIDGTLVIEEENPRVDKILFTGGNLVNVTNSYVDDGILTVEGIAKTNVVYLNDETNSLQSVELEVPFVLNERTGLQNSVDLDVVAVLTDVDVAVKKGRELFYDAKLKVIVYNDKTEVSAVISNVTLNENIAEKDYAMEIVFGKKGQTAWDIAKANKVKESLLTSQNPETIFPLSENTELVLFYQNTKNIKIS